MILEEVHEHKNSIAALDVQDAIIDVGLVLADQAQPHANQTLARDR